MTLIRNLVFFLQFGLAIVNFRAPANSAYPMHAKSKISDALLRS